jgi:hypothetical protein
MSGADRSSRAGRLTDRRAEDRKEMTMMATITEIREIDWDEMAGVNGGDYVDPSNPPFCPPYMWPYRYPLPPPIVLPPPSNPLA